MKSNLALDIIRWLFFAIDKIVYFFVDRVYNLFIDISNTTIFTDTMIDNFLGKVYYLVGIFMLFKVAFAVLTYIINPDEFADKNKGMGKMVSNIVTSLALLVAVPFIFDEAMDIQRIVLKDDIIPKMFSTENVGVSSKDRNEGSQMAFIALHTFYAPNEPFANIDDLFDSEVNETKNDKYVHHYDFIISTVVGVILVLILLSFCLDIAVRSVKLGFLRLMAPIPIIGRIDPKKGNELFSKWTKNCINTYLDLFIRLAAIFFALFIINSVSDTGVELNDATVRFTEAPLLVVFIILGTLMFAKQLPKLLNELLGINLDGGKFSLNPLKKIENEAIGGKVIRNVPRAATGAALGLGMGAVGAATGAGALRSLSGLAHGLSDGLHGKKLSDIHKSNISTNQKMREAIADGSTFGGRIGAHASNLIGSQGRSGRLSARDKELEEEIKAQEQFHNSFDGMKSAISSAIEGQKLGRFSDKYNQLKSDVEAAKIKKDSIKKEDYLVTKTKLKLNAKGIMETVTETELDTTAYNNAVANAANEVVKAENAVGKYLKSEAINDYYNAYRSGTLAEKEKEDSVMRAFEKFDAEAKLIEVEDENGHMKQLTAEDLNTYENIKKKDGKVSDRITDLQNQRVEIRKEKQVASADKNAINK